MNERINEWRTSESRLMYWALRRGLNATRPSSEVVHGQRIANFHSVNAAFTATQKYPRATWIWEEVQVHPR